MNTKKRPTDPHRNAVDTGKSGSNRRWSQRVGQTSDAMDLEPGVFRRTDPLSIARSIKRSAERSRRRKSEPFRSAMSMLTFYINRAGKNLPKTQRNRLMTAKNMLCDLFKRGEANS